MNVFISVTPAGGTITTQNINVNNIAFIGDEGGKCIITMTNGQSFNVSQTLAQIMGLIAAL